MHDPFQAAVAALGTQLPAGPGSSLLLPTIPESAEALMVFALSRAPGRLVLWITDGQKSLEIAHQNITSLAAFATGRETPSSVVGHPSSVLYYPALETFPGQGTAADPETLGYRLSALRTLSRLDDRRQTTDDRPGKRNPPSSVLRPPSSVVLVTSVQALMQKTLPPDTFAGQIVSLAVGDNIELDDLTATLERSGYEFVAEVEDKQQAALRGGLLDAWSPDTPWPVRIELFGPEVASLRQFDPLTQKSVDSIDRLSLLPPLELPVGTPASRSAGLFAYLPENTVLAWSDLDAVREHATLYEEAAAESAEHPALVANLRSLQAQVTRRGFSKVVFGAPEPGAGSTPVFRSLDAVSALGSDALSADLAGSARRRLIEDLAARSADGQCVAVFFDTPGTRDHFLSEASGFSFQPSAFSSVVQPLSEGFVCDDLGLVVVAESDVYGQRKLFGQRYRPGAAGLRPRKDVGQRITDLTHLEPGDLVIHSEYGRGRYLGLYEILFNGQHQEVLTIEYADKAKLHVPVTQAHLLSRYVGIQRRQAELHRLGSKRWNKEKQDASGAIVDLAASLLEVQASRRLLKGHAFPSENPWQREFEAAFPFHETEDQRQAIEDVRRDMEAPRPMDRLACGDAGYGKTEVAMRAAFKAVMDNRQVAVLVPTTVLAQQHYETFSRRMAPYPVRIEMLSRFRARAEQAAVLHDLAEGAVDIVIGTHALIQPQVLFKDLGLVIIDEEQRFGVGHKEHLKQLRQLVDVLTLTATPIPRTLHMSLMGVREMSLIQTPPTERVPIETVVAKNTDAVVRQAILRELNREGQVFYLHNRVMTIERVLARLRRVVPEAHIEIAHGQMSARMLSDVMRRFSRGKFDVLLCTTIIESGTDIPRVNTILIDRADRFGLADLYQLRGRVGRSHQKAYAYLLLPDQEQIDARARRRIKAIRRYSSLSAGFNIALRDLEIRGAGNLLGAEQSGHINAIGFGLYCQLLERTVARLKGAELPPVIDVEVLLDFITLSAQAPGRSAAVLPHTYVEDEHLRVGLYRRIAGAAWRRDVGDIRSELQDRFGPLPPEAERLLQIASLRIAGAAAGITRVEVRDAKVMCTRNGQFVMQARRFPRLTASGVDERLDELIALVKTL